MKKCTLLFCLIVSLQSLFGKSVELTGVINDVSPDETKVLYTCKTDISEAYSDGALYLYDRITERSIQIAYEKFLDYSRKSFFINNDSILIIQSDSVFIYSLKSKAKRNIFSCPDKLEYILSSFIGSESNIFLNIQNSDKSEVTLLKFSNKSRTLEKVTSNKVTIIPTDNFFFYYTFEDKIYLLDNSSFYNIADFKQKENPLKIGFNDDLGNYVISSNEKFICLLEKNESGCQILVISKIAPNKIVVNIPIKNNDRIWIEPRIHSDKLMLSIMNVIYSISPTGQFKEEPSNIIFQGKTFFVTKKEPFKIELS
ncbi:MAG: hypothetical protein WCK02_03950 [Bacteroidota bacterium]